MNRYDYSFLIINVFFYRLAPQNELLGKRSIIVLLPAAPPPLLQREADIVKTRIAASDLERDVRRTSHLTQQKITAAADRYMAQEISSGAYLKICGSIYAAPFE